MYDYSTIYSLKIVLRL